MIDLPAVTLLRLFALLWSVVITLTSACGLVVYLPAGTVQHVINCFTLTVSNRMAPSHLLPPLTAHRKPLTPAENVLALPQRIVQVLRKTHFTFTCNCWICINSLFPRGRAYPVTARGWVSRSLLKHTL